nr:MAG TPA: hypothetical protein [Caudoviricetes sp.]
MQLKAGGRSGEKATPRCIAAPYRIPPEGYFRGVCGRIGNPCFVPFTRVFSRSVGAATNPSKTFRERSASCP